MRTRYAAAIVAVAVCGVAGAVLATGDEGASAGTRATGRHCVLDVGTGAERCFEDYRSAISFATRGAIDDAPLEARQAVGDAAFQTRVRALAGRTATGAAGDFKAAALKGADQEGAVIAATLFTGPNYTGDSETIRTPKPCAKDGYYDYYYTLGSIGRSAESVQPWANCWIWLHDGDTFDSPRQGPYKTDTPDLGDWKNRAVLMGLS